MNYFNTAICVMALAISGCSITNDSTSVDGCGGAAPTPIVNAKPDAGPAPPPPKNEAGVGTPGKDVPAQVEALDCPSTRPCAHYGKCCYITNEGCLSVCIACTGFDSKLPELWCSTPVPGSGS